MNHFAKLTQKKGDTPLKKDSVEGCPHFFCIFKKLLKHYGPRKWWPARTRFEVIVGAILTQNVSWRNAKKAVDNLKKSKLLSPEKIAKAPRRKIASKIKSSRFYNQKAKNLKIFSKYLLKNYNGSLDRMFSSDMESLRRELLRLKGMGRETVDCILLYAGKKLSFVSDAYTKRLLERYGLIAADKDYDEIRAFFMESLPQDLYVYNEFHALIVHHGNRTCKSKPNCPECPIRTIPPRLQCRFATK